jgi:PST family polysaccharide transporter
MLLGQVEGGCDFGDHSCGARRPGGASTWLFTSQGRGRDMLIAGSINSLVTVLSYIAGLPYGPIGVATAFSISGPLVRLPILYFIVGRRGPVRTFDLWAAFFRHLPLWIVVFSVTWLTLSVVPHLAPHIELLICGPVGLLTAVAYIWIFSSQRQVAIHLFETIRQLKQNP